jgi:hypothetical protein
MPKKKVIKKTAPKKSITPKKNTVSKPELKLDTNVKLVSTKQGLVEVKVRNEGQSKKDTRKYVKIYENDPPEKRKEIGERIFKKEIKFAYYASEGSQGVWYYVIL